MAKEGIGNKVALIIKLESYFFEAERSQVRLKGAERN